MDLGHFKTRDFEVWANNNLSGGEMRVYNALLCFLDWNKGVCFPSNERISEFSGIKAQPSITRITNQLVQKGLIKKWRKPPQESKGWGSNVYQILNYKVSRYQNTTSGKIVPPTTPAQTAMTEKQLDKLIGELLNDH